MAQRTPDGPIPPKEPWRPNGKHGNVGGRPSKLTMNVVTDILQAIEIGTPLAHAAKAAGVHRDTIYGWLERAKADEALYAADGTETLHLQFSDALSKAEGHAVVRALLSVYQGVDKWQASAWWLERRYPDEFALKKDTSPPTQFIFQGPPVPKDDALPPGSEIE